MKLSLGILLMAAPIFMLSLGILFNQSRNNVKEEATEHANSVLNTTMQRVSRFMENVETSTNINDWEVTENLNPDSLLAYSRFIVVMNGNVDGCSISTEPNIFPKYGRHFSAYTVRETDTVTTVVEEEYEYFEKVWYKTPKTLGEPCWVVYYDESDSLALTLDGMIASYSKPLYNADQQFVGVISTDLALLHLSRVIAAEKPYPGSYFMMTDEEGRYYIHPDTAKLFTHTIFTDTDPRQHSDIITLGHEMTTGKQGNMSVNIDGEPCLVSYQPVPGTKWSLALVCPDRSVLQNYNRLGYIIAPLTIVGLLLILLFSSVSVAHAIRPLNKLADKIQRIAVGHYDEPINRSTHHDAVGRLQNSFATMQESLSSHVNNIRQMNIEASRRNEELVQASELAKEGNRQKSLFIQNVSHQIRTPLNIIMGFSQVLRDSKSVIAEEEAKSITDTMNYNALLLRRMSLMLFDSSPKGITQEHYMSLDEEVFCNEIATMCIDDMHKVCPDVPVAFDTSLPDSYSIITNKLYLRLTLEELLYNSAKYSDGQNVAMRVSETSDTIRFCIQDTGPGIPEEDSNRFFVSFTKANDLSDGLGLGLPLCRRHILNLKGSLKLDTTYHNGCRIIIELPK